jgi:arylsulfatase A-like enzyme
VCFISLLPVLGVAARPNILLVTVDTTRPDHLSCYGYEYETTEYLDRLAAESVVFTTARSVIPLTTPSHASIMTGLHPETHQVFANNHPVDSSFTMMAEIFKKEGYSTGAFVSVRLVDAELGFYQGFDFFSGLSEAEQESPPSASADTGEKRMSKRRIERRGDETIDAALRWLEQTADKPFFTWIHLYDPHLPYVPPEEYGVLFNRDYANYLDQIRNSLGEKFEVKQAEGKPMTLGSRLIQVLGLAEEYRIPRDISPELAEKMIRAYDGEIAFADAQLARVFGFLQDKGKYDDTIVIVMGDHGEILYEKEKYFGHHRYLYKGSLMIPLIMKFPEVPARQIDVTITNVDILPTLLEALKIEKKVEMDGVSYWPLISRGEQVEMPEYRFYLTNTGERLRPPPERGPGRLAKMKKRLRTAASKAMVTGGRFWRKIQKLLSIQPKWNIDERFQKFAVLRGDWKLIRSMIWDEEKGKRAIRYELYNLGSDPQETQDLSVDEEAVMEELKAELSAFLKQKRIMKVLPEERNKTEEERREEMRTLRSLGYIQ